MTPLDEAPEQRWRRTVDRRNRPAKLKVDRLLRDFGYAELDPEVGAAIEARLAGVALAVAPSLRNAVPGEVITLYANDSAAPVEALSDDAPPVAPLQVAPVAADARPVEVTPAEPPTAVTDVAEMVTYLKQQVLDARAESEQLRNDMELRIAEARHDIEREAESIIAEQAAALQEQRRQLAELGAALNRTRQALAETRDEIRRAVGELQALPEPVAADDEPPVEDDAAPLDDEQAPSGDDEQPAEEPGLSGEQWADGREEAEAARAAALVEAPEPEVAEPVSDIGGPPPAPVAEAPAPVAVAPGPVAEEAAPVAEKAPASDVDEPPFAVVEESAPAVEAPASDVDEPPLAVAEPPVRAVEEPVSDVDEPPLASEHGPAAVEAPVLSDAGEWQPEAPAPPEEPETNVTWLRERDARRAADIDSADLDTPLSASNEWLPADFGAPAEERPADTEVPAAAGETEPASDGDDRLTDFDDFLYDADELYDPTAPDAGAAADESLESQIEARWPDESAAALPPPPPPPPSPFSDEPPPTRSAPPGRAPLGRPPLAKVLRGRSGRHRSRWDGSCSICGRLPLENRRKHLESAGWDLSDHAAACPQCRGIG